MKTVSIFTLRVESCDLSDLFYDLRVHVLVLDGTEQTVNDFTAQQFHHAINHLHRKKKTFHGTANFSSPKFGLCKGMII